MLQDVWIAFLRRQSPVLPKWGIALKWVKAYTLT